MKEGVSHSTKQNEMDKDFLRQIDDVEALLPDAEAEKLSDDVLICECFCVSVGDIRMACAEAGTVDVDLLQQRFDLGKSCQSCLKRLDSWIHKIF